MKKISYILTLLTTASALLLSSCAKEKAVGIAEGELVEYTLQANVAGTGAGLDIDTKVALNTDGITPNWEEGDQILVLGVDKTPVGANGIFTLESGKGTASATFKGKVKSGQVPTYAIYPVSVYDAATGKFTLPATQDGTKASAFKDNAVMLGVISEGNTTFTNACSVLKINTGDYGKSGGDPAIKYVTVSAASGLAGEFTIDWEGATPTISPATEGAEVSTTASSGSYTANTDIYIPVIPTGSQTFDFDFINTEGKYASVSESFAAAANTIKALGTAGGMKFKPLYLPGVFSVSATKKVQFSSGNLYWDGSKFLFENNQWESTPSSTGTWDPSHVSHFYWSNNPSVAIAEEYNDESASEDDVFFINDPENAEKANPDFTVNGVKGKFRTLSTTEWNYLFSTRPSASSKYGFATVAGVHGIIILPDGEFQDPMKNNGSRAFVPSATTGWTANVYTTGGNWEAMETAGAVFLPTAGRRNGSNVLTVGDASTYWSSSASASNRAYRVNITSLKVSSDSTFDRLAGCSVRLITESN